MNKKEELKLAEIAKEAAQLRKAASNADSMLRTWSRHKGQVKGGKIRLSLYDRFNSNWSTGADLPAELIQQELVPILKRVRDEALAKLKEMKLPG